MSRASEGKATDLLHRLYAIFDAPPGADLVIDASWETYDEAVELMARLDRMTVALTMLGRDIVMVREGVVRFRSDVHALDMLCTIVDGSLDKVAALRREIVSGVTVPGALV